VFMLLFHVDATVWCTVYLFKLVCLHMCVRRVDDQRFEDFPGDFEDFQEFDQPPEFAEGKWP